jgi:hypothetical protein
MISHVRIVLPQASSLKTQAYPRVCSWESSQSPKLADGVRLLALVLADARRCQACR